MNKKKTPQNTSINYTYMASLLLQIQNLSTQHILSPHEFKENFEVAPKFIKDALHQANTRFSPRNRLPTIHPPLENMQIEHTTHDNQR
jgi:hypothetical protein